ncbi:MAG: hypothetical protein M3R55_01725 [Acidobacteriota bacterium]|nr:hypothetical protein [Acidobacteriota bacterium]
MLSLRRSSLFIGACTALLLTYAWTHLYLFGPSLEEGVWEHVHGVTRFIIPDTLLYLLISQVDTFGAVIQASGVKNSVGPSLVWWILDHSWRAVSVFNAACFMLMLVYVRRLILHLDPDQRGTFNRIALVLLFVAAYYSVGSLKEIPTLLGFTAFVHHFIARQRLKAMLWFLFLTLFRFQFAYLIVPAYALSKLRANPLRLTLMSLLVIGMLFPLVSILEVFTPAAVQSHRSGADLVPDSLGSKVEMARGRIAGVSFVAILVRIAQTVFEPLIQLVGRRTFFEAGSLSVYLLHSTVVLLLMLPSWYTLFVKRLWEVRQSDPKSAQFGTLYAFVAISIFAYGGTGIVSHRFLVPAYALLLVAARVDPVAAHEPALAPGATG